MNDRSNYFVFCFAENYPPICVGVFSALTGGQAISGAIKEIGINPKYRVLLGMSKRFQVARSVR